MGPARAEIVGLYEHYLACCNERRLDELAGLVAEEVAGSGSVDGRAAYVERVADVLRAFPDYRWDLQEVLVDGSTVVARLRGSGTHEGPLGAIAPTGRRVEVQELVVYRFAGGLVTHCWGDLFPVLRDALTAPEDVTG
ncbi:ester cyclase [Microlunatus flavus]|uniref:Predicted ester cyclase n=1 Tax=Microlunatus flavus TaxID=1036181 RepID=A0A1H9AN71_9ACTN|nr:ester cyclase [Microlunatus flavus]SEP78109.1 Predicted ester cyclase [Microlunatus flavus]